MLNRLLTDCSESLSSFASFSDHYTGVVALIGDVLLLCGAVLFYKLVLKQCISRLKSRRSAKQFLSMSLLRDVAEDFPGLLRLNRYGNLLAFLVLAMNASAGLIFAGMAGLINIALIANCLGSYELGEHLLKIGANPDRVTLASQECAFDYMSAQEMNRALPVVSKIYGSGSLQMAYTYGYFTERYIALGDHDLAKMYCAKATGLCSELGVAREVPEILAGIAKSWAWVDNKAEARTCIRHALKETHIRRYWLKSLYHTAKEIKDKELMEEISARIEHLNNARRHHHRFGIWVWILFTLSYFAALIAAPPWWMNFLHRKWTSTLASATDDIVKMRTLDKLTTLALYRKKLDEAKIYSSKLIDLAFAQLR